MVCLHVHLRSLCTVCGNLIIGSRIVPPLTCLSTGIIQAPPLWHTLILFKRTFFLGSTAIFVRYSRTISRTSRASFDETVFIFCSLIPSGEKWAPKNEVFFFGAVLAFFPSVFVLDFSEHQHCSHEQGSWMGAEVQRSNIPYPTATPAATSATASSCSDSPLLRRPTTARPSPPTPTSPTRTPTWATCWPGQAAPVAGLWVSRCGERQGVTAWFGKTQQFFFPGIFPLEMTICGIWTVPATAVALSSPLPAQLSDICFVHF